MSANSVSKRSSSVAQEDLKAKQPLAGSFASLAPPRGDESMLEVCADFIADADAGLNGIDANDLRSACLMCDDHGRDVKNFQEKQPGTVPSLLSFSLVAVLALYTTELAGVSPYGACNAALRSADRSKCKPYIRFIWFLMHALAKCERYVGGNVYRGVKADLRAQYPKDREVTWFQFSSCSCDIEVEQSEQFLGKTGTRTLFSIELTTGRARSITKFSLVPSEAEVLLPPNSRFVVLGQLDAGNGLTIITLRELPSRDPILHFDSDPASATTTSTSYSSASSAATIAAAAAPVAVPSAAAEDPEILALSQALKALDVGTVSACLNFAKALSDQGILTMERLKKMPAPQAKKALGIVKMTEFQIDTVMEAIAPPSSAAAAAISPAPSPASAPSAPALFQEGQRLYGEQRFSEAAERWERAALLRHGPSHAHLSDMLIYGRPGVAKDVKRAFALAGAGAAMGCAHSKGVLSDCYLGGFGVAKDEARGLALGRESEAAGSCFGQVVVAWCYGGGCGGVAQDDAEAARLYRLAADQGYAVAQNNLGCMFKHGQGVAKDYAEAARLYRLAAEQGYAVAQVSLGLMFRNGYGVAEDKAEAIRWYHLAAAQGDTLATAALKRLGA
jgi:TPR repeat protein